MNKTFIGYCLVEDYDESAEYIEVYMPEYDHDTYYCAENVYMLVPGTGWGEVFKYGEPVETSYGYAYKVYTKEQ